MGDDIQRDDGHQRVVQEIGDFFFLFWSHFCYDLQGFLGVASHDACSDRGFQAFHALGVGYDDAFHVLDDVAASLDFHAFGHFAKDFMRFGGSVGQTDRFGAAHGGHEFLFQNAQIGGV